MTFKIRTVVLLATILFLVIPMAACQDAATPAEPADVADPADAVSEPEEVITLRYASFTAEEMPAEVALVEEYNATHPGVFIALEPCPAFECYDKLVLSHQAGTSPDVYSGWWTYDVASVGLAINLDSYIEAAGGQEFIDRYVPGAFAFGMKDGSSYSLPWRTGAAVTYINETLLEKAGLSLPEQGWTWEDFREYAIAMTDPDAGHYGFALSGHPADTGVEWEYWAFLLQNGGYWLEDNRAAFNGPEGVGAMEYLLELIYEDKVVHPGIAEMDVSQVLDLLAADKVGMWVEGPWYINALRATYPDSKVTLVYNPVNVQDGATAGGTNLMISPDSEHPQEAFDFIAWMTAPEQLARWAAGAAFLPAAVGADTDPAFQTKEMQAAIGTTKLPNSKTSNLYPENNALNSIIRQYIIAAYLGEMEPQDALDQAAVEWNEILAKYYP